MRLSVQSSILSLSACLFIGTLGLWYTLSQDVQRTKHLIDEYQVTQLTPKRYHAVPATTKQKTESTSLSTAAVPQQKLKRQLWSTLQHKLKNTVVQVMAQVVEFNWVEPYKTPTQKEGAGTAFFINESGELITNAHVVNQAQIVHIQIPTIGKQRFKVSVVAVSPERDLALLRLHPKDIELIKKTLGLKALPYLKFGDSDEINRADKIMALGYPLGQHGLKSTTGVVSGREHLMGQYFIQISAPLNEGNSGGPSLNSEGEVIGVNSAGIKGAQNVGYIVPVNEIKLFLDQVNGLPQTKQTQLIRKPFLGVLFNNASESLTRFLGNPLPGGLYVVELYKGSPLDKAGVKPGDMIYKVNGLSVDIYGEMHTPWSGEEKISIVDYVSRLKLGQRVQVEFYRNGTKKVATFTFDQSKQPPIRRVYPGYEKVDYEVIGGFVVMQLTLNHVMLLAQFAPELMQYADLRKYKKPALLITHVLLNSPATQARAIGAGAILSEINGQQVETLDDFKKALLKGDGKFITIKSADNAFSVIPIQDILKSEKRLASTYFYPLSNSYHMLAQKYDKSIKNK